MKEDAVPFKPDGSEAAFFRFLEEYEALISRHVPGDYEFEYRSKLYMLPVYRHLERVAAATPPGGRILEIGCGRGHFSAYLAMRGFQVEGLEVDNPQPGDDFLHNQDTATINHYPKLWAQAKQDYGADCHYYDGVKIPASEGAYDTVLYYASFEHIPVAAIQAVADDSFRVLKPGGSAFIFRCPSDWAWKEHLTRFLKMGAHEKLYGKGEALSILRRAGYQLVSFQRSDLFPGYVGPLQGLVNAGAKPLLALEAVLRWTPLAYIYHHFEIEVRKP
jgi:2-polyprenyl-3-methyl-5-hydroxy-6-metoxy-1,4-benzoquinol methylase